MAAFLSTYDVVTVTVIQPTIPLLSEASILSSDCNAHITVHLLRYARKNPMSQKGDSLVNVMKYRPGGRFLKNLTNVHRRKPFRLTLSYV